MKQSIPSLIQLLAFPNGDRRRAAIRELIEYNMKAVPYLITALNDPKPVVRILAEDILCKIGPGIRKQLWDSLYNSMDNEWLCSKITSLLSRMRLGPVTKEEAVYFDLASGNHKGILKYGEILVRPLINTFAWYKQSHIRRARWLIKKIGFSCFSYLIQSATHSNDNIRIQSLDLLQGFCRKIKTIFLGKSGDLVRKKKKRIVVNPDVRNLMLPLDRLKTVIIESTGYDPLSLESFLTYTVNYMDENYLKTRVCIKILGRPEELNPGHFNIVKNSFKMVTAYTVT